MTDRQWDKRLRVRTVGREDETDPNYSPYEPTPYSVLERLAGSGHIRRKQHLLDYGCGKGRVAFFMASVVGCRVTGIDHSRKLIDIAAENRRASRLGDRVTLRCCPAEHYEPVDEDAFFCFNPFSEKVFEGVLRSLRRAFDQAPREMTLACYYPSDEWLRCLEAAEAWQTIDDIDCNDLFGGRRNPRERIVVYRMTE